MGSTLKESSAFQSELRMPDSAIRHQNASPSDKGKVTICDGKPGDEDRPKKSSVCKSIEGCQEELVTQVVREKIRLSLLSLSPRQCVMCGSPFLSEKEKNKMKTEKKDPSSHYNQKL